MLSWDRSKGGHQVPSPPDAPPQARIVHIAEYFFHKQFVVLCFREIEDIAHAEQIRGAEVLASADLLWIPDEGSYFVHELLGFEMVDSTSGDQIGRVVGIDPGAAQDFIRVRSESREFLVPFAKAIVANVSTVEKRIYVDLPAGLDEL